MNRILIYLLPFAFVLTLAACNSGEHDHQDHDHQKEKDEQKVANLSWKDLTKKDTIQLGDTSRVPYVFFNTGWKPVRLLQCVARGPHCECEVPDYDIEPGGTDTVWVTSVPVDNNSFTRYLDITHNNPKQKKFMISLYLTVEE
jgi:hypothetical protein